MSWDELVSILHDLNRAEKLRVMQYLIHELADEDHIVLLPATDYPVWTPYDAYDAAQTMLTMFEDVS